MTQMNIRIDEAVKAQAEILFDELGLNMTTAVNMFIKTAIRENGIPFDLKIDPFYSERNMEVLNKSIQDANEGRLIERELIEVD